jgi:hypothetical protein
MIIKANAFASTFHFFADSQTNHKKNEKSLQATAQGRCKLDTTDLRQERSTGYNSTYPKGGVSSSADSFVVKESSVLRMKFSGKNPALRVAANR